MDTLSDIDKEIFNNLITPDRIKNKDVRNLDIIDQQIIKNLLANIDGVSTKKKDYIEYMMELFEVFYKSYDDDNDYSYQMCLKISKIIVKEFCTDKYNSNFPNNLFSQNFIEFLYDNDLLYNNLKTSETNITLNVFHSLVNDKKTIDYFGYKLNTKHCKEYIKITNVIIKTLNTQIYTYLTPSVNIINRCINVLSLVQEMISTQSDEATDDELFMDYLELIKTNKQLFMLIYSTICDIISVDNHTLTVYEQIGGSPLINGTITTQMKKQIKEFKGYIDRLKNLEYFTSDVVSGITNFDISNSERSSELIESEVRTFTYLYNSETFLGKKDDFVKFISSTKQLIPIILKSEKINIHSKTKLILEMSEVYLKDSANELIELFIDIEKYNPETGYNEKHKLRNKVLYVLRTNNQTNILESVDSSVLNEFITIFASHFIYLFTQLKETKIKLQNNRNYNPTFTVQIALYTKYVEEVSLFMNSLNTIKDITSNKIYLYKQIEVIYSAIELSLSSRLYSEVPLFQNSNVSLKVLTGSCSSKLEKIYSNLFSHLDCLLHNKSFVDAFAKNTSMYIPKSLENTKKYFGEFVYQTHNGETKKINDLITKLVTKVDTAIEIIEQEDSSYSEDIPEKFLDPIMCIPIDTPVEIPGVKQIVDFYTINNHLTFSHTNPFTNSPLTKDELQKYNEQSDVIERVNIFKQEFSKWKLEHKM